MHLLPPLQATDCAKPEKKGAVFSLSIKEQLLIFHQASNIGVNSLLCL